MLGHRLRRRPSIIPTSVDPVETIETKRFLSNLTPYKYLSHLFLLHLNTYQLRVCYIGVAYQCRVSN